MWSQLPIELWIGILGGASQNDLAALSSTCKHLHALTEPLLYSRFSWIPDLSNKRLPRMPIPTVYEYITSPGNLSRNRPRIHLLLRTLLNRPELTRHIKSAEFMSPLFIDGRSMNPLPFWSKDALPRSGFTHEEIEMAETAIKEMGFLPQESWLEGLRHGKSDIILALLLSQLSEITSLDIRFRTVYCQPPVVGSTILELLNSRSVTSGASRFKNLNKISLSIDRDQDGSQTCAGRMGLLRRFDSQVAPVWNIPSLEELSLSWLYPEPPMGLAPLPIAANLAILILRDNRIKEDVLATLIRATPHLKTLDSDLTYYEARSERCHCHDLNAGLSQVASTLETLVISIRMIQENRPSQPWRIIEGAMGSMKHYQKLKHLAMPLIMLAESPNTRLVEVLPHQLDTFEVGWQDPRQSIEHVEAQLAGYLDEDSMLQTMKVNVSNNWSTNFKAKLSKLPGSKDGQFNTDRQLELMII